MSPLVQAAILGVVQGVTEFLPVSSTAHLLIASRLLGFQDPGGVFTVMIQLGSIFAVVWLYRAKILEVIAGLPSKPEARRFARHAVRGARAGPGGRGGSSGGFIKRVLYNSCAVSGATFVLGGVVILLVERYQPVAVVRDVDSTPIGKAFGIGVCQATGDCAGRVPVGRDHHGGLALGLDRAVGRRSSRSFWRCRR